MQQHSYQCIEAIPDVVPQVFDTLTGDIGFRYDWQRGNEEAFIEAIQRGIQDFDEAVERGDEQEIQDAADVLDRIALYVEDEGGLLPHQRSMLLGNNALSGKHTLLELLLKPLKITPNPPYHAFFDGLFNEDEVIFLIHNIRSHLFAAIKELIDDEYLNMHNFFHQEMSDFHLEILQTGILS